MMNRQCAAILGVLILIVLLPRATLAARGETPAAFGRRCIPPPPQRGCRVGGPGSGCVAPPSHTPVCSVVAPCHPGAALRDLVLVQRGRATSRLFYQHKPR